MTKDNISMLPTGGSEINVIPVIQGELPTKIDESQLTDTLPVLPLREAVLFPGAIFPITVGRKKSVKLI